MNEYWNKRNVYATIIIGLLTSAVTWYVSSNQETASRDKIKTFESLEEPPEPSEPVSPELPTVSIFSIHVSEVAMDIPAAFELGIEAGGVTNRAVHNIDVLLNFGRAEIQVCDYSPKSAVADVVSEDKNYHRLTIKKLQPKEKFYVRCLISSPLFDQVIIEGNSIKYGESISFEQYQANLQTKSSNPAGFWTKLVHAWAIILTVAACLVILRYVLR